MCGIAGIINAFDRSELDLPVLERMALSIAHRGPDDQGIQVGDDWALISRRLAIIGVTSGHQPLANEDGTVWVAFNGEIYNHRNLRRDLEAAGHRFATDTDTEILVHLYEEHGDDLCTHLNGMFAFALVDTRRGRALLARDRLGQKPLFYRLASDGHLVFGSELAALTCHPAVDTQVDPQAVSDYLSFGYVPAPLTIYRGIAKLPPGHTLSLSLADGTTRAAPYWRASFEPKAVLSWPDAVEQTGELLQRAVERRLESEVPLGAFLSGGLDSSLVTAMMSRATAEPVRTFCIGFGESDYDEREYARRVAAHIGSQHRDRVAEPRDVALLERLVRHCGEPFCDSSILPTALLAGFTREHVTVALSGDGGDELFGGYERYRVMALFRYLRACPTAVRRAVAGAIRVALPRSTDPKGALTAAHRLLEAAARGPLSAFASFQEIFSPAAKAELLASASADEGQGAELESWERILARGDARDFVEQFLMLDLCAYLPGDLLYKVDIASMAYSLEVRCPFLDPDLVAAVCRWPRSWKVGLRRRKALLQACAAECLPEAIAGRGKQGFGVPVSRWLRGDLRPQIEALPRTTGTWDPEGLFDPAAVSALVADHLGGRSEHGYRLWALLCYRLWRQQA